MHRVGEFTFRWATTNEEFEAVHRLNHATFVREIPQHSDTGTGRLVDKFHEKNRYLVGRTNAGRVVAMLSAHDTPPFSVASRLPDPGVLSAPGVRPVEIRLLAVEPEYRNSFVMLSLVYALYVDCEARGYTHFAISGVVGQQRLYEHMGFVPLGPAAGEGTAAFIPMWVRLPDLEVRTRRTLTLIAKRTAREDATG
jgi:hypothetical protein